MAGTDWWVLVPEASEMDVAGTVADAFIVSVAQGSAVDKELLANYAGKVTVGGKSGYLRAGPFTTEAAAQAYLKTGAQNASVAPGLSVTPSGQYTSSIPGLAQIGNFFTDLASGNLWLRVIKIAIGGILLITGLVHLTGIEGSQADYVRKAVPLPI